MNQDQKIIIQAALRYAERGISVFPCAKNQRGDIDPKQPLTKHGFYDATTDAEQIKKWWKKWPNALIGMPTGKTSGVFVLDVDSYKPEGRKTLEALLRNNGDLPETRLAKTGGGGKQYFFKYPGYKIKSGNGEKGPIGPGVDLKADGGYVILPPSGHPSGGQYVWIEDITAAKAPEWLLELIKEPPKQERTTGGERKEFQGSSTAYALKALEEETAKVQYAVKDTRNQTLNEAAFNLGTLVAGGELSRTLVEQALRDAALATGLPEREIKKTLNSGLTSGEKKPRQAPQNNHRSEPHYQKPEMEQSEPEKDPEESSNLAFPSWAMTGAAGQYAGIYGQHLETPECFLFMGYLTCLGSVLANKTTLESELAPQPRLFTLLLGESADERKSTVLNKTVSLFKGFFQDFHACMGVGSAEGLQNQLSDIQGQGLLLCYDEFKSFVSKCKIESSVLLPCVNTLFESNQYETHTKKHDLVLENAFLSMLAASTVQTYEHTWDTSFTDIGFNNRLFIVPATAERKFSLPEKINPSDKAEVESELLKVIRHADGNRELKITPEGKAFYHDWYMNLERSIHAKRLDTYALRLMVLLAVNNLKSEIDLETVKQATGFCDWQLEVRKQHDPIDADNTTAKMEEKIRRALRQGPMADRVLKSRTNCHRVGIWFFDMAKKNLEKAGEIKWDKKEKRWNRTQI